MAILKTDARKIQIELQVSDNVITASYQSKEFTHVDVQFSTREQRQGLRILFLGLHATSTRLANGKHVDSQADAVRYLMEQITKRGADGEEKKA